MVLRISFSLIWSFNEMEIRCFCCCESADSDWIHSVAFSFLDCVENANKRIEVDVKRFDSISLFIYYERQLDAIL